MANKENFRFGSLRTGLYTYGGGITHSILRVPEMEEEASVDDARFVRLNPAFQQRHRLLIVGVRRLDNEAHVNHRKPIVRRPV